ncbi:MAG TPA: RodZ domain-containing protein [Angustibacter sp.]|nr:RodZ domain-containing protein [Angustibacter sp.]
MSEQGPTAEREPLGRSLVAAREARGQSVADVAAAINLRETVVRAIERDDFSLCGGDVYARGHVRAYARQVGLDPAPLLEAYAAQHGGAHRASTVAEPAAVAAGPVPVAPLRARGRAGGVPLERTGPNWSLVVGAVLTVVVVLLVVQLVSDLRGPSRPTSEVAAPAGTATSIPTPSTSASSTGTPAATSPVSTPSQTSAPTPSATAPARGVAIALRLTGDSWVSVRDAAGRTVFSGLLSKGDARNFTDGKALRLTLGSAGDVQLTVNGKAIGAAGGKGQVVRLKFGPGDPA